MIHSSPKRGRRLRLLTGVLVLATIVAPLLTASPVSLAQEAPAAPEGGPVFDTPTTSSPITLSADKNFIWSVNPDDGSVSVLGDLDGDPRLLTTIKNVGREPQAVALDTTNHAYVVSPPDNGVKVIDITSSNPATFRAVPRAGFLTTGAEPWNLVASPDGSRIFVANSGQDTITVIRTDNQTIVGSVDLRNSLCNVDDANRRFQPRGLAVTLDGQRLYVARFLSYTTPDGVQGVDGDKEGVVCQLDIPANVAEVPEVANVVRLAAFDSGFPPPTGGAIAHPNQMQSIVIYRDQAYLPNIGAATAGPDRFNSSTMALVNVVDNVNADGVGSDTPADAVDKAINLHLGARVPEPDKEKLFFANPWAIGFRNNGGTVNAYAVSAGSDLLVKLNVDATGDLNFTNGVSTTRYIDLNDPEDPATQGRNAGKNPLGIVIRNNRAFVMNYISRNVSVVDLDSDAVTKVIETTALPAPGSFDEQLLVGKEMFFSSRGHFDRPNGTTVSTNERLSQEAWQNCASCHFAGLTDGNVWFFGSGPRKSVPLNASWSPHNPDDQRLFNYSAVFDELQDFELNIRNTSGPGPLNLQGKPPAACAFLPPPAQPNIPGTTAIFDPNHGLIIGDDGDINKAPCVVNQFAKPNAGRPQVTVTLPGSNKAWPAFDAMKEWARFAIRTPEGALTTDVLPANQGGLDATTVSQGRRLFFRAGCQECHGGTKWTNSNKNFTSPPAATDLAQEAPVTTTGASQLQMFDPALVEINSFNLNVAGQGNTIPGQPEIGAVEVNNAGAKALGIDHNGDGKGAGYNIPSLLGIGLLPPYYHNGACETLACVLANPDHRTGNGRFPDRLSNPADQAKVVAWLETLDAETPFPTNLSIRSHDIFFNPPRLVKGQTVEIGANIKLFGTKADLANLLSDLGQQGLVIRFQVDPGLPSSDVTLTAADFNQDFGQAVVTTTFTIPANATGAKVQVIIDPDNQFLEDKETDNRADRSARVRNAAPDTVPPVVTSVGLSDEDPFVDNDLFATSKDAQVKIVASDAGGSGLKSYCIVQYRYNTPTREWVPQSCSFRTLPAPETDGSFLVDTQLNAFFGVAYAFVWVRDAAGNISIVPGFDVISYVPAGEIRINRNDVFILRVPLAEGDSETISVTPLTGDVDLAVFADFTDPEANRIDLSANNGTVCEEVTLTAQAGESNRFQVEIEAIVNSRVEIRLGPCEDADVSAASINTSDEVRLGPDKPIVAGPPLRAAIEDEGEDGGAAGALYLPLVTAGK
jgi:DNA-binding beta-propeller fold protein YncE